LQKELARMHAIEDAIAAERDARVAYTKRCETWRIGAHKAVRNSEQKRSKLRAQMRT
jgi:hypothetical protein